MRMGTTSADGAGRITWCDEKPRQRLRWITVNELGEEIKR
jgi:hypothetical protein